MSTPQRISRRHLLRGAAAASAPFALPGCGGAGTDAAGPTEATLAQANRLTDHPLSAERIRTIVPAARMNHGFFRAVRDLEIPDLVEPAVVFVARGPSPGEE